MTSIDKPLILKPWTLNHQKRYNALYNYIITTKKLNYNKDNFINGRENEILNIIINNTSWSDATKEAYLFMGARYLFNNSNVYHKIFSDTAYKIKMKIEEEAGNNELDDKEIENFKTHEELINIISMFRTPLTKTEHYKQLLLKLLVLQPPLRTSFYTSALICKSKKDNDDINNFICINRRGGITGHYIINKDKATNYKLYNLNKNLSFIELTPEAAAALSESLLLYPRFKLFEINNNNITQETILNWLRDATRTPKINIDIMRASFITWFHDNNKKFNDRDKLSKLMRHSEQTASKNYRKVIKNNNIITTEEELRKELILKNNRINELELQILTYTPPEKNANYKKQRKDVLYNLNVKGSDPRETTLKKYNIIYDTNSNNYI